jgi:hypothetical protein
LKDFFPGSFVKTQKNQEKTGVSQRTKPHQ